MAPLLKKGQQQVAREVPRQHLPRPYKCPLCDKAFHRLEHQIRHIRTHTGEKPHACTYRGCIKKFSRSDELIRQDFQTVICVCSLSNPCYRHSRIHNNPNSRRGKGDHAAAHQAAVVTIEAGPIAAGLTGPGPGLAHVMSSPRQSNTGSPNVSPPHPLSNYPPSIGTDLARYRHAGLSNSTDGLSRNMNSITDAASKREQFSGHNSHPSRHQPNSHGCHPYYGRLPGICQDAYLLQSMLKLPFYKDDGSYAERRTKGSSPGSSMSPAPPSPSFSHDSADPTPDYTPLATPAHSPRPRFHGLNGLNDLQLPSLRHSNLNHGLLPALAPMEPSIGQEQLYVSNHSSGFEICDFISNPEGAQRKLPASGVSKILVQDLLNDASLSSFSSGTSVTSALAGENLVRCM